MRKLKLLFLGVLLLHVAFCEAQINPAIASYVKVCKQ